MRYSKTKRRSKIAVYLLLALCAVAVFVLVFYKGWGGIGYFRDNCASFEIWKRSSILSSINIVPFRFVFDAKGYSVFSWLVNVAGNIALFVPAGIFAFVLFPKRRNRSLLSFAALSALFALSIETLQLLSMCGNFDIDDILLNAFGMCAGFAVARLRNGMYTRTETE